MGRYCPIRQCHMRRMWGHHKLTAAFEPTHTTHTLRHSVVHCRQGQHVNAENTEGLGFPGLFEKKSGLLPATLISQTEHASGGER